MRGPPRFAGSEGEQRDFHARGRCHARYGVLFVRPQVRIHVGVEHRDEDREPQSPQKVAAIAPVVLVIEEVAEDGDIRYYRDASEVHHVPKRSLEEIIVKSFGTITKFPEHFI